jgi:hypothetical protein
MTLRGALPWGAERALLSWAGADGDAGAGAERQMVDSGARRIPVSGENKNRGRTKRGGGSPAAPHG